MKRTKLRYQTWLLEDEATREIVHHSTAVITHYKQEDIYVATTGGYYSRTTKARMNSEIPNVYFFIKDGEWMVKDRTDTYPYNDGMRFKNGQLIGGDS